VTLAIEAKGLSKVFGKGQGALRAVDGLSLEVQPGEVFGFLGPNGAGKSTTIRMLTGISRPNQGKAFVLGREVSPDLPMAKDDVGYMPEMPGFYPGMRAVDQLTFWADFHHIPRAEARRRAKELLAEVGLAEHGERKAKDFSHGMKKRLSLAGALLADPEVLILDEPSGGLDPEGTLFFRRLIERKKKEGKTVFLSSHLLPEVQMICDRVGIINRGRMVAVDRVEELARKVSRRAPVRLQVQCAPISPAQAEAVLRVEGVVGWSALPTGIVVEATPGTSPGFELNRAMLAAGVRVEGFWPIVPSLEQVFMQILQDAEAAAARGGGPA
jgi:ABC-2 type transport system ATP-binding protein